MHVIDIKIFHQAGSEFNAYLMPPGSEIKYLVSYSEVKGIAVINGYKTTVTGVEMALGGYRYFFICPTCRDRKQKLVMTNSGLSCKKCLGIVPSSLNRSKNDCNYYWNLAEKIARSLDPSFSIYPTLGGCGNKRFPDKPKGMHWNTYSKKYMKYKEYKEKGDSAWLGSAGSR